MEVAMFVITLVSMVATVISCIIAVKAKNESRNILATIQNINTGTQNLQNKSVKNKGRIDIKNSGENDGVMAGIVTGGISNNAKK
ncbi:hypothetical protein [Cytobacillus pseudoceanisediminis]|uniref:hypothetical protein n=1 Tax=Cytobacillus pseudoceanisediminis TaxID=3051614 RepID=UPI003C2EC27E